ncbi:Two-component system response regulator QseB [Acidisarcina polymorpha]|uniref:Two-component system response regulator QseB n=1 Tax=Acidisarcina polymorpha TaxID=2211140 RepID=A0A2Z5FS14_9BACT|nr:response regulator transcription factor [Acidisarcina polymorpha]AXC09528.1 Two-component system response regulator QseB [Acidisarcina polymorpha]
MRILIAEDDAALGLFLKRGLEADGHQVRWTMDGDAATAAFIAETPDLTILDLNLPRRNGGEVLASIRALGDESPVLILTARQEMEVRISCLDAGADDCMIKPFSLEELRARCRALMRRRRETNLILRHSGLELNRIDHTVKRDGQTIALTNKEFALLEFLLLHRGTCISRSTLLDRLWSAEAQTGTNVVDVYVNYLRRKLRDFPPDSIIQTVRGQGYCIASNPLRSMISH